MTALTGTNLVNAHWTEGEELTFLGKYTLAGDIVTADTITWENALPNMNGITVLSAEVFGDPLDSNATPTATLTLGNEDDADGLVASATIADTLTGYGALVGVESTGTSVILTVGGTLATAATTGDEVFVKVTYGCGDFTQ
mgnify:CR=1 FL=1|jgi:hypothetical protein